MANNIKKLKAHKCSIKECMNLVKFKGSFCNNCINKICDEDYVIILCPICETLLDVIKLEECYESDNNKIKYCICCDCFSQFEIIQGDDEPLDE
ncbi:MAG: hypothetical protein QHH13_11805 [Melioribacter sp.]|uniref:hypothetical protein n=1 Tax=Rosettibacter primus TaxID=3111523 RepID=UPI00247E3EBB|nr:hypothetical protein [Melioribacter sp.]